MKMNEEKSFIDKIIIFFIVLLVGFTIANEIEKLLPKELRPNYKKIFLEALAFAIILGFLIFIILKLLGFGC